ncbi:MAG: hypothetical protein PW788_04855 [Micavibrio sp.]|nr:hypothetical protein [Micavibrio sp.]
MQNPGFDLLKEAFKKFAQKHDGEDLGNRLVRSVAAGGEAAVNKGLTEFPKAFVKTVAQDFFNMVTSQEVADGVSLSARSFDEEKVKETLDTLVAKLQEPETSLKVAKQIKDVLSKASTDDLENSIEALMDGRPMGEQMIFKMFFAQAKPLIDGMRDASEEEIAEQVRDLAATIPTDAIASQVAALTKEVTPERVSKQAHDLVGKLPSPGAVSEILHGVAGLASKKLGDISNSPNASLDAKNLLGEFVAEAQAVVKEKIANDDQNKKTFKKGGQDFSL